ncbi:MAG: Mrp/NBP35 family ATP-binding protein [Deltaproteobacteria bacterium]|nr:Mrp/NBP35 family ATP-binding protein [Deltaproteobacteria bacterium]
MAFFTKKKAAAGVAPGEILSALSKVMDPELGKDLVTLNMIRNVEVTDGAVALDLVLTTPACPMKEQMRAAVEEAVRAVPGVASVEVRVSSDVRAAKDPGEGKRTIPGVRNVVAVASGKGGVGKSTISANLAVALARAGARVGLLDADIYGPSVPTLFHLKGHRLTGEDDKIVPAEAHGLKIVSIGFLLEDDTPVIWRGPMLMKALEQFLHGTKWGELDYLVIDLPPGTGDVQISFLCPHCAGRSEIFGHGGARKACAEMGLRFLGEIPLQMALRESSDAGEPLVASAPDSPAARAIAKAAADTAASLAVLNSLVSV